MKKIYWIIIVVIICHNFLQAQIFSPGDTAHISMIKAPPLDEQPLIYEVGAGGGIPYGMFGFKGSLGLPSITADVGLGIIPLGWDVSAAVGASVHFFNRYSAVSPRVTILYTNTATYNLILKQSSIGSTPSVFYKEAFPGYAVFGGMDIRLGALSEFFLSVNIGVVNSFIGNDEAEKRYKVQKAKLISQGYAMESETVAYNIFPKISIGVSYILGRSLVLQVQ